MHDWVDTVHSNAILGYHLLRDQVEEQVGCLVDETVGSGIC